jgi:hypothetical protein
MNRRDMMKLAATQTAMVALPAVTVAPSARAESMSSPATLKNAQFELTLSPGTGLQCKLVHVPSDKVLADGYSYSFGLPALTAEKVDGSSIVLHAKMDTGLAFKHRFTVDPAASGLKNKLSLPIPARHHSIFTMRGVALCSRCSSKARK